MVLRELLRGDPVLVEAAYEVKQFNVLAGYICTRHHPVQASGALGAVYLCAACFRSPNLWLLGLSPGFDSLRLSAAPGSYHELPG